jgi:hypothetical protein
MSNRRPERDVAFDTSRFATVQKRWPDGCLLSKAVPCCEAIGTLDEMRVTLAQLFVSIQCPGVTANIKLDPQFHNGAQ